MRGWFSFEYDPVIRYRSRWRTFELGEDWRFRLLGRDYVTRSGQDTDGASTPTALLSLVGPRWSPDVILAAIAHDGWYGSGEMCRLKADLLFWLILLLDVLHRVRVYLQGSPRQLLTGLPRLLVQTLVWGALKSTLMFLAVFLFGWVAWCAHPGRGWSFSGPALRVPDAPKVDEIDD